MNLDWRAAMWSGLLAGVVFLILEMALVPLLGGGSPWEPVRMIAAIGLGESVLPPPATFNLFVVISALLIHGALSVVYAIVLGGMIHRTTTTASIVIGILFGLGLYIANFYGFTAIFPWFVEARNDITIVAHIAFGVTSALFYHRLSLEKPVEFGPAAPTAIP